MAPFYKISYIPSPHVPESLLLTFIQAPIFRRGVSICTQIMAAIVFSATLAADPESALVIVVKSKVMI